MDAQEWMGGVMVARNPSDTILVTPAKAGVHLPTWLVAIGPEMDSRFRGNDDFMQIADFT